MTNRLYNESFTANLGQLAQGAAFEAQFSAIEAGFDAVQAELDALQGITGVTSLSGFPASFSGAAGKYAVVNAAESALEFIPGGRVGVKSVSGTSYTVLAADAGKVVHFTNASAVTVTVPKNTLAQGDVVCFRQAGAGQVTLVGASGVTLNSTDNLLATRKQHAQIAIVCDDATTDANVFGVLGERNAPALDVPVLIQLACSDLTTNLTTGTGKAYFRAPYAFTITEVRASLDDPSSSGAVTVDINVSGSTILSTKLTIDATEETSETAATPPVLSSTAVADDAKVTVDIDGAGTDAKGLIVTIIGVRV